VRSSVITNFSFLIQNEYKMSYEIEIQVKGTKHALMSMIDNIRDGEWPLNEFSNWDAERFEQVAKLIKQNNNYNNQTGISPWASN
jgi:hypothetical protein